MTARRETAFRKMKTVSDLAREEKTKQVAAQRHIMRSFGSHNVFYVTLNVTQDVIILKDLESKTVTKLIRLLH